MAGILIRTVHDASAALAHFARLVPRRRRERIPGTVTRGSWHSSKSLSSLPLFLLILKHMDNTTTPTTLASSLSPTLIRDCTTNSEDVLTSPPNFTVSEEEHSRYESYGSSSNGFKGERETTARICASYISNGEPLENFSIYRRITNNYFKTGSSINIFF